MEGDHSRREVNVAKPDWDAHYAEGNLPWDTGAPDENLVASVRAGAVTPGRTLEIGCGTGTNALWLAAQGFDVLTRRPRLGKLAKLGLIARALVARRSLRTLHVPASPPPESVRQFATAPGGGNREEP